MKKVIVACILLTAAAAIVCAQSEEVMMYDVLYRNAATNSEQLGLLQNMKESQLTGAGDFYARALHRLLLEYSNVKSSTEKDAADEQAIILSSMLGDEKYTQAATDLWQVVETFAAPLVKAEALMALGRIEAKSFLPHVIQILKSTNMSPTRDRLNGERIAFGAIIALEKYQEPDGILPVFAAATGWYSARVKNQALKSLSYIAEDPTPAMIEVIKSSSYNYAEKYTALQFIENYTPPEDNGPARGNVSNDSKASAAVAALAEGWRVNTTDRQELAVLANMRKLAIAMINRYKTTDASVYPSLERSYSRGDEDERLSAIAALASLGTDDSARMLARFLSELNSKRQINNIKREDETMVRAVISALGVNKNVLGEPALNTVITLDWTPAVKNLARQALQH